MKFLMIPYIIVAIFFGVLGVSQGRKYHQTAWGMFVCLGMLVASPLFAKIIHLL